MADLPAPRGTVGPTRIAVLFAVFAVGAVLGWVFVAVAERINSVAPRLEWTSVVGLAAIAAIVSVLAYSTYRAVHRERRLIEARRAVNLLLLAKASALTGALLGGAYVGFGLQFLDQLDAALPRDRAIKAGCAAVAAVAMVVAGLLLERACRVPKVEEE